ncbi:polysaccharide deacetylase family protein, partial [Clostridium perfringens]|nr:polysaccharide deacetylase family protein [Clostridium perfringens]
MVNIKKFNKYFNFFIMLIFFNNMNYIPVSALYAENNRKTVYLTFDDGPSANITKGLISVLNNNEVKGTFFIVGDYAGIY